jgi:DNA helicase-2/ATP-dependent DNA helicase PcrA
MVVLDDEESAYNLFSYGKYFGFLPLSDTDRDNIATGKDSVLDRTRRLLYVCCSRARLDLIVVLFVPDVATTMPVIVARGLFPTESIYIAEDLAR